MDVDAPTALLGGRSPAAFMRAHWQRKPLIVRQAWPGVKPPLTRAALFALAARDDVESRLVQRFGRRWTLAHGPLPRGALPRLATPAWTLLVQGLEQHSEVAAGMLSRFRFVPEARLDDLMMSWASAGGGVGAHVDSYDVFLLQVHGRRRWRIAPPADERFRAGLPLRVLAHFAPVQQWLLEPGDMLYLPPHWGHEGVAVGDECMTCSIGFRAPGEGELGRELLARLADRPAADAGGRRYADAPAAATRRPGAIPPALQRFAARSVAGLVRGRADLAVVLGEYLSEPKREVWFDASARSGAGLGRGGIRLDRRTRMLYDERHLFVNGEAFVAPEGEADTELLRALADRRLLDRRQWRALSAGARTLLRQWARAGWLQGENSDG